VIGGPREPGARGEILRKAEDRRLPSVPQDVRPNFKKKRLQRRPRKVNVQDRVAWIRRGGKRSLRVSRKSNVSNNLYKEGLGSEGAASYTLLRQLAEGENWVLGKKRKSSI